MLPLQKVILLTKNATSLFMAIMSPQAWLLIKDKTIAMIPLMVLLIRVEIPATGMSVAKTLVEITMTVTSMQMICAALVEAKDKNKTFAMIPPMVLLIRVEIPATGMSVAKTFVENSMTVTSMHMKCAALAEVKYTNKAEEAIACLFIKNKTIAMIPPMVQLIWVEILATGMSVAKTIVENSMTVTSMHMKCAALAKPGDCYMNGARKKERSNGNIS